MNSRKADGGRTIFVSLALAFIILIAYFTGAFGYIGEIIFGAKQLPDFLFGNSTSGVSLVALNLNDEMDLQYFTGEKWKTIDSSKDYQFTLGAYVFEPSKIRGELYDFYAKTERRPIEFSVSVNDWRYWEVSSLENKNYETITVPIESLTKSGFSDAEFKHSAFLDTNNNLVDYPGKASDKIFPQEKNSLAYQTTIAWRDSILEGNACESFIYLPIGLSNEVDSTKEVAYTVRKIDQYLFVDLDRPVLYTTNEKWKNETCFKVEEYDDALIDRSDWKNDASVQFYYTEENNVNDWEKLWWTSQKLWGYQHSDVTQGNGMILASDRIDSQPKFRNLLNGKSFYEGLIAITSIKGYLYDRDAEFDESDRGVYVADSKTSLKIDFVKGYEWGEWKGDKQSIVNRFNYLVLDEYNKHFRYPYFIKFADTPFGKTGFVFTGPISGISNTEVFTGVILVKGEVFYISYSIYDSFDVVSKVPGLKQSPGVVGVIDKDGILSVTKPLPTQDSLGFFNNNLALEELNKALNSLNGEKIDILFSDKTISESPSILYGDKS
ncbi:MAG: hypothetical protein ACP5NS_02225 [Candidatus Pacearchaeota archaeon]